MTTTSTSTNNKVFVPIIMGSKRDMPHAEKIGQTLADYGVGFEYRVASAHKAPRFLLGELENYEADGRAKVYITIAGRSNALSALVDGQVAAPVIACPPYSDAFGGGDIYSSLRMPSGITPLVILDPGGAALAAIKVLSLVEPSLRASIQKFQKGLSEGITSDDADLQKEIKGQSS